MSKEKDRKTNAIREMEAAHADFDTRFFESPEALSGVEVAALLEQDPDCVFKTLVTQGKSGQHFVFMIPVACELDLKKAARAAGEKSIAMVKSRDLLGLTGYIHGGCSPVGMKKLFPTVLDESARALPACYVSGGRIGVQMRVNPAALAAFIGAAFAPITMP